jgi:hypothetical protein
MGKTGKEFRAREVRQFTIGDCLHQQDYANEVTQVTPIQKAPRPEERCSFCEELKLKLESLGVPVSSGTRVVTESMLPYDLRTWETRLHDLFHTYKVGKKRYDDVLRKREEKVKAFNEALATYGSKIASGLKGMAADLQKARVKAAQVEWTAKNLPALEAVMSAIPLPEKPRAWDVIVAEARTAWVKAAKAERTKAIAAHKKEAAQALADGAKVAGPIAKTITAELFEKFCGKMPS